MTYFDKFLIQGLSKYYKKNYHDFFLKIWKKFKNILKYFKNISPKIVIKQVDVAHVIMFSPFYQEI
jgi:hypothetical protein